MKTVEIELCWCGRRAGEEHAADCPWPMWAGTSSQRLVWDEARERQRAARRAAEAYLRHRADL
jgi:hypothetical protein